MRHRHLQTRGPCQESLEERLNGSCSSDEKMTLQQKRFENKASKMTILIGQQASKCKANHEAPPAESSKVASEPRREAITDWHCLDFNLA